MKYTTEHYYPFFEDEEVRRIPLRKLAELTGVHYTYLSRLKNGKAAASEEMKYRLVTWLEAKRLMVPATPTGGDSKNQHHGNEDM